MGRLRRRMLEHRLVLIILTHALLATVAYVAAFILRFDVTWPPPPPYGHVALKTLPLFVTTAVACAGCFGLFSGMWRYVCMHDVTNIAKSSAVTYVAFTAAQAVLFSGPPTLPRSIAPLATVFTLLGFSGIRYAIRKSREMSRPNRTVDDLPALLIVGAGDAGNMIARDLHENRDAGYRLMGFLDDDPHKQRLTLHGYEVLGTVADLPSVASSLAIDQVLIAMPSASGRRIREIVNLARECDLECKTLPGVESLMDGTVTTSQIRDVSVDDLLRRAPVALDLPDIERLVTGQTVMVTGAGGSIGSELCRQICRLRPSALILFERSEPCLYGIDQELGESYPAVRLVPIAGDVCDAAQLSHVLTRHAPGLVLHAAAYKHVPLMETNVSRAVLNNVVGTLTLARSCLYHDVGTFVLVSTDKAVNPTSIMGCTKRVAELIVQELATRGKTRFVTVRFGNVLGSVGSVVPLFRRQIAAGGPITVTHPDMRRYFMTIPEAAQLILEAATLGQGGEVFVLDMGEPVRIVDLARDLIRLSGLVEIEDVTIVYTGLRPGEKLFEEILTTGEGTKPTRHPGIVVARVATTTGPAFRQDLDRLAALAANPDDEGCRATLMKLVPEFEPRVPVEAPPLAAVPTADLPESCAAAQVQPGRPRPAPLN